MRRNAASLRELKALLEEIRRANSVWTACYYSGKLTTGDPQHARELFLAIMNPLSNAISADQELDFLQEIRRYYQTDVEAAISHPNMSISYYLDKAIVRILSRIENGIVQITANKLPTPVTDNDKSMSAQPDMVNIRTAHSTPAANPWIDDEALFQIQEINEMVGRSWTVYSTPAANLWVRPYSLYATILRLFPDSRFGPDDIQEMMAIFRQGCIVNHSAKGWLVREFTLTALQALREQWRVRHGWFARLRLS